MNSYTLLDEWFDLLQNLRSTGCIRKGVEKPVLSLQQRHTSRPISDLCILCSSNVHQCSGSGMNHIQQLQDSRSVICRGSANWIFPRGGC